MGSAPETIKAFAELVLFSPQLESKLFTPAPILSDNTRGTPGSFQTPSLPARESGLSLTPGGKSRQITFPARAKLSEDRARGLVLHYFANHELLALELMALALLRWPDAPEGFRRGLVQTMFEEQGHMRLYLARMRDLGVEFGEAPLNAFFWKCMNDLETPAQFAAAMSMTFEQANLDFALHYETLFRAEGDLPSAEIMRRVRLEEIGHVKHGFLWFERWRPRCERLFKEWQDTLRFPMTPARAKGIAFDVEGRLAAGLPQDYIDELAVHNQSKGRPPRVFWFNPGAEQEIEAGDQKWTPPKPILDLTSDYCTLMGFLALASDIVLVKHHPSVEFLKTLGDMGFEIPEFVREEDLASLKARKFNNFEPWGWSPASRRLFAPLRSMLLTPEVARDNTPATASGSIFSKSLAADIRDKLGHQDIQTIRVTSMDDAMRALSTLRPSSPSKTVVFKAPFSASGRGMIRVRDDEISKTDAAWILRHLDKNGMILAEPWLDRLVDLSAHVDIDRDGNVKFIGITRFWTDQRGQYRGHIIGRPFDDLGADFLKSWHAECGWQREMRETVIRVGHEAFQAGYHGPLGIDAFIYKTTHGPRLRSLVEINPRWSMGRVALALSRRVVTKHCGLWIHISRSELARSGHADFSALMTSLRTIHPTRITLNETSRFLEQGAFALNDPQAARQSLALLIVGRDLNECYHVLTSGGLHDSQLDIQIKAGGYVHQSPPSADGM